MKKITDIPVDRIAIAPSILSANFANLKEEVKKIESYGADLVHLDIMDGHFVPNITIGPPVVSSLRQYSNLLFDAHLMITNPLKYIDEFTKAGVDHITFHIESDDDPMKVIEKIKKNNLSVGISIKPKTNIDKISKYLELIDLVLVMTVEPGFGGQSFMDDMLPKIEEIKKTIQSVNRDIHLQVDGGISYKTISKAYKSGANNFVAGTAIFKHPKGIKEAIDELKAIERL